MGVLDVFRRPRVEVVERSTPYALSFDEWAGLISSFAFNGVNYTLPGSAQENIGASFTGLARGGYKGNGVVFACMLNRMLLFAEARFMFRRLRGGRPGDLFGTGELRLLNEPWSGGTTGDLLSRMIQHVDIAGNAYVARRAGRLVPLRPDWVTIIGGVTGDADATVWHPDAEVLGYAYQEGGPGSGKDVELFLAEEVAHFAPIPDPEARFRGMSWLTPVVREVMADKAMNDHKLAFFENGATPNIAVKLNVDDLAKFQAFVKEFRSQHEGATNAYKTMFLAAGADVTPVGVDMKQLDFKITQGAGETRVAAAAGVPPVIVGLSEGLAAATYSVPGEQTVWTSDGPRQIGEIRAGDRVWKLEAGEVVLGTVTWQGQTGVSPVYEIKTKNRTFRATGNHPVLMPDGSWKLVSDLTCEDRVLTPVGLPDQGGRALPDGTEATPDAMRWLGAFIGDGSLSDGGQVRMSIPVEDRVRDYYEQLPPRLFTKAANGQWSAPGRRADDGLTDTMVKLRNQGLTFKQIREEMQVGLHPMSIRDRVAVATRVYEGERLPVRVSECRNGFQFYSVEAARWLVAMGAAGNAKTKRVPSWVFGLAEDLRLEFLAGVVDTDGSIGRDGRLTIHFANEDLVRDVRMLLVSCGIQCSNIVKYRYPATVLPNPGRQDEYAAWRFTASSAVAVARIPFADELYRDRVTRNHPQGGGGLARMTRTQHRNRPNGTGVYKIVSITRGEVAVPVYDIEVDGGDNVFLADGVAVHNSNYSQARRRFADGTMRPLWRNAAGSLARIINVPSDAELWYDDRDIPALQEDQKDAAEIQSTRSRSIKMLLDAGFTAESVVAAVTNEDFTLLNHSGLFSVQLQPPGASQPAQPPLPAPSNGNGKRSDLPLELLERLLPQRDERPINLNFQPPDINVDVQTPAVTVGQPSITMEPTRFEEGAIQVHMAPPDVNVNVEPTQVTLEPQRIEEGAIQVHTHMETPKPADVNVVVEPAQVTVEPPRFEEGSIQVNVDAPASPDVNVTVEAPSVTVERGGKRRVDFGDGRTATVTEGDAKRILYDDGREVTITEVDD